MFCLSILQKSDNQALWQQLDKAAVLRVPFISIEHSDDEVLVASLKGPHVCRCCSVLALRTGKLKTLVENLRREQQDMVRSASELQALKERLDRLGESKVAEGCKGHGRSWNS